MLTLTLKKNQGFTVGQGVRVIIAKSGASRVVVRIEAPEELGIERFDAPPPERPLTHARTKPFRPWSKKKKDKPGPALPGKKEGE